VVLPSEVASLPASAQQAVKAAAIVSAAETPEEQQARRAAAQALGYRTIGLDLPQSVTLTSVVNSMPKEVCCP
jgi:hypothetical protein